MTTGSRAHRHQGAPVDYYEVCYYFIPVRVSTFTFCSPFKVDTLYILPIITSLYPRLLLHIFHLPVFGLD